MLRTIVVVLAGLAAIVAAVVWARFDVWHWFETREPLTASFTVDRAEGQAPLVVTLDGAGSTDPDGQIEDYIWHIDDEEIGRGPELEHTFDTPGEYTVTLTVIDDDGAAASTSHPIVVHRLPVPPPDWEAVLEPEQPMPPLLAHIEPPDGAVIRATEVWVRWDASDDEAEGRVLWREAGEAEVRVTAATGRARLAAHLTGLQTGATYEYVVEQFIGDFGQRSELRRFTVEGDVEFVPPVVEAAIERDHGQQVTLTLRNTTGEAITVAAQAVTQIEDLPADIIGRGSVENPVELPSEEELELLLSIYAADATQHTYEIAVEAAGAVGRANLTVGLPTMDLSFEVVREDERTLAQWIEVHNVGDTLTDLSLRVVPPHDREVRLEPAVGSARLDAGHAMEIVATPVLYLEFDRLSAEIEATAAGQSERYTITFEAPPDVRLMAARAHNPDSTETTSAFMSWCAPEKCTDLQGGGGTGPATVGWPSLSDAEQTLSEWLCDQNPCTREELRQHYDKAEQLQQEFYELIKEYQRRDERLRRARILPGDPHAKRLFERLARDRDMALARAIAKRREYDAHREYILERCTVLLPEITVSLDLPDSSETHPCEQFIEWYDGLRPSAQARLPDNFRRLNCQDQMWKQYWLFEARKARGAAGVGGFCCGVAPHPIVRPACCVAAVGDAALSELYYSYAKDPPSDDYHHVVQPNLVNVTTEVQSDPIMAQAQEFWEATQSYDAYGWAWLESYEKYQGAQRAGDMEAMVLQAQGMVRYSELMVDAAGKANKFKETVLQEIVETVNAAAEMGLEAAVEEYLRAVNDAGSTDEQREVLLALGVPESDIEELGQLMLEVTREQLEAGLEELRLELERMEARDGVQADAPEGPVFESQQVQDALYLESFSNDLIYRGEIKLLRSVEAEAQMGPAVRSGLLQALQQRASFSRKHRGPLAASVVGEADNSEAFAAGYHTGDRVVFAWHQDGDQVVFAAFDSLGETMMAPQVIGTGQWPRVTAQGDSTAVAWETGDGFAVRIHDGAEWGEEIALGGREAALGFAADGALHAATTSGIWRLVDGAFEQVRDGTYSQPALAIDSDGEPHLAWVSDGQILVEGEAVAHGEQPSLIFAPDGTLHLAYLFDGSLFVRQRQAGVWSDAEEIPADNPRWPALAQGAGDEVRVSYIGDAEIGPPALWLVRLPDTEPILMPSLAGNVTDAWFTLTNELRGPRSNYRPMDILVTVNDVWAKHFHQSVPEGRYLVGLDPRHVFTSSGRPAWNRIGVHRWYGNAGANVMWANYTLTVRRAWSEYYGFAATPEEVVAAHEATHRINHDQPDLALLANAVDLPVETPTGPIELPITVANLGEAESLPAQLVMLGDDAEVQRVEIPILHRDEQVVINLRVDGRLEHASFRIEYEDPEYQDFDPSNDELSLHLWSEEDYDEVEPLRLERFPDEPEAVVATYPNDLHPAWIAGALPAGATAIGDWEWSHFPAYQEIPSHAAPREEGRSLHYFIRADEVLPLAVGDNLIQYVYLDPDAPPEQIMLRAFLDGRHEGAAVYWGGEEDLMRVAGEAATRVGELPETGRWVRMKVPIEEFGIESAWIDGLLFGHHDGQVSWGPTTKSVERLDNSPRVMAVTGD